MGDSGSDVCKSVVVVTDSITVNRIWYRCRADYFLVPNERSARVLRAGGIEHEKIKRLDFRSAQNSPRRKYLRMPEDSVPQVLYMINAGKRIAPDIVQRLVALPNVNLTVTVGRDEKLRHVLEKVRRIRSSVRYRRLDGRLPPHALESFAHRQSGRCDRAGNDSGTFPDDYQSHGARTGRRKCAADRGNRLGVVAFSPEAIAQVSAHLPTTRIWREWDANIRQLSRPSASLDIARFILSL